MIDDIYTLLIGDEDLESDPLYILLKSANGESIDIQTEDVEAFLLDN